MDSKSTFISMKEKTDFLDSIISSHSNDDEGEYDRAYRKRLREVPGSWVLSNVRELYQQVGNIFASRRFTSKGFSSPPVIELLFPWKFKSKVLEEAYTYAEAYSYWLACQKMLKLGIVICLLNAWRESQPVIKVNIFHIGMYNSFNFATIEHFVTEIHMIALIYLCFATLCLFATMYFGPLWTDHIIFWSYLISHCIHFLHNVNRMGAYHKEFFHNSCLPLEDHMLLPSDNTIIKQCSDMFLNGVDFLNLNAIFCSLIIVKLAIRRLELRIICLLCTVSLFALLLIGDTYYNRYSNSTWQIFWGLLYVIIWLLVCYDEEVTKRLRFLKHQVRV